MGRLIPGTHILKTLREFKIPEDRVLEICDYYTINSKSISLQTGYDESAVEKAGSDNAFWILWFSERIYSNYRLYFFAQNEQEIIDRFKIAQVMLV